MIDENFLADPERLDALARTGLGPAGDPMFDRFAEMVRKILVVPIALVSLVDQHRQVFPGACGLAEPWQQRRQTPLSHSFCQHVVTTNQPLVIVDARTDPRAAGNLAVTELGVVGYAGMPLTDQRGLVLGSLCAIDTVPRQWTPAELDLLGDLAAACSDSLRLRSASRAAGFREDVARVRERAADAALDRSQMLLRASAALANTTTAVDVAATAHGLITGALKPDHVDILLHDTAGDAHQSGLPAARVPSALAVAGGAPVLLPDPAAVAGRAPDAVADFAAAGWQSAASVPLPGAGGALGALTVAWNHPHALNEAEQAVLAALAGYVAQALQRADYLFSREQVANLLQQAMLSDLPDTTPFELAARYAPAVRGDQVGGDWYDAVRLDADHLALVVGDVTGHDMHAAARMGQLRSMLRAYIADRNEPPSALLRRLDNATQLLGDRIPASAILAYVQPDGTGHRLQWANAGHPSPLLIEPGGRVTTLAGRDMLLGVLRRTPRTNFTHPLPPGSTVLFYTDGLVETRTDVIDDRKEQLRRVLAGLAGVPLDELLDEVLARLAGDDHEDDVALLALRSPAG